jgi:ABC-type uncharacterized transport system permease subunit
LTELLTVVAAPALYVLAALVLAVGLHRNLSALRIGGLLLAVIGVLAHAAASLNEMQAIGGFPADFFSALSVVSLVIVAVLLLAALRFPLTEILPVALPGAALMILLKITLGPIPEPLQVDSAVIELHVISSLLAYSLLSIAALNAMFIAVQHNLLHRHRNPALLDLLPPLATLEVLLFQLITGGWLLLTVSLASGLLFVDNLFAQHLVHKTALSLLAWLIFGGLLIGRWRYGWRGMRVVRLCLIGMAMLVLAYFGSKAVLELLLDRRWQAG